MRHIVKAGIFTMAFSALGAFAPAGAANITYTGTQSIGGNAVFLSITTDGTIGAIGRDQIKSYTITMPAVSLSYDAARAWYDNSGEYNLTTILQATADTLSLPAITPGEANHEIGFHPVGSWSYYYSVGAGTVFSYAYGQHLVAGSASPAFAAVSGAFILGKVGGYNGIAGVPEPASWAMMLAGFGAVGAAMRRRRVAVRFG